MYFSFDFIGRRVSLAMLAVACGVTSAAAADWPYWRGPTFDGTAEATGLGKTAGSDNQKKYADGADDFRSKETPRPAGQYATGEPNHRVRGGRNTHKRT